MSKTPSAAKRPVKPALAALITVFAYILAQILGAMAFGFVSARLIDFWGVTDKSLPYAPVWLQTALASYASLEAAAGALAGFIAVLLCAKFLLRRPLRFRIGHILLGAGIGFALSALCFGALYFTDSVRCMPAAGVSILGECIALWTALASALAPEALLGGTLWPLMRGKTWLRAIVFTLLGALMYVLAAYWTLPSVLCVVAMSAACAALYAKRSFWAAAALRCFFGVFAHRLFGFSASGAPGIFVETYPVSRDWLTGGDLGLEAGWLCALLFMLTAALIWKFLKIPATEE